MSIIVQYPYASDENNSIVFIKDIDTNYMYHHYRCPYCGKQMYPLGGNTSYAHEANNNCTDDAYILASAKQILAKRFNLRQEPFLIGVISKRYCADAEGCKEIKRKHSVNSVSMEPYFFIYLHQSTL